MNEILQKRIEEAAFQESSMYDTIQEKNAAYSTGMKIANFALQNQWISVDEELPKDDGCYIVTKYKDGKTFITRFATWSIKEYKFEVSFEVTHWMPIPTLEGGEE